MSVRSTFALAGASLALAAAPAAVAQASASAGTSVSVRVEGVKPRPARADDRPCTGQRVDHHRRHPAGSLPGGQRGRSAERRDPPPLERASTPRGLGHRDHQDPRRDRQVRSARSLLGHLRQQHVRQQGDLRPQAQAGRADPVRRRAGHRDAHAARAERTQQGHRGADVHPEGRGLQRQGQGRTGRRASRCPGPPSPATRTAWSPSPSPVAARLTSRRPGRASSAQHRWPSRSASARRPRPIMPGRFRALAVTLAAAAAMGGCGLGPGPGTRQVTLTVTADFGAPADRRRQRAPGRRARRP